MGKVRFGLSKDSSSVRQVRTPEAIIQYIDRVVEVPGPERILYVDKVQEIEKIVEVSKNIEGPERVIYLDRNIEVPIEVIRTEIQEKIVEIPVITKGDDMELKELASRFERHEDFSNQKQNEQNIELKNLKNKLDKQQKLFFIYGAISGILTVLGFVLTK